MTPLEKAARAAHGYEYAHEEAFPDWGDANPEYFAGLARAVLMAVRELEGATLEAGQEALIAEHGLRETPDFYAGAVEGFAAMIDAILSEGTKPS